MHKFYTFKTYYADGSYFCRISVREDYVIRTDHTSINEAKHNGLVNLVIKDRKSLPFVKQEEFEIEVYS